jgi:hypothetical protein
MRRFTVLGLIYQRTGQEKLAAETLARAQNRESVQGSKSVVTRETAKRGRLPDSLFKGI